ncbi:uncharacterized protein LOC126739409 isoform X1 [Anthonomus grandis grandis]|uniref:uncharacterized protein LOC126739409 isoform X1 n=1 Tax=Anthonomus grandis grandis TaxID=2921223 RepID=UPI0021664904|nr:uncharacterized protein LOC126739409 isoform X1 [Anthonomus grandis grandis]
MNLPVFLVPIFLSTIFSLGTAFELKLVCDGPIILGATLNCTTKILNDDGRNLASGNFRYFWWDDAIPTNSKTTETAGSIDTWQVTYNSSIHKPGQYTIRVDVCKWILNLICTYETSAGTFITLTENLNGQMILSQNDSYRDTYVSTRQTLKNSIKLKQSDQAYISTAQSVISYWFVDCVYYGVITNMSFNYNFTKPEENHLIEALVVGDFTPLPPPTTVAPSTTTPKVSTTSTTPKPTTSPTSTTKKPSSKQKRAVKNESASNETQSNIKIWQNGTLVPYNGTFPYVCNSTIITTDNKKVYGYFRRVITTKEPVSNITVSGNNWLKHGDLLSLNINCKGSQKMQFCVFIKDGLYNVTGNETCERYIDLDKCDFPIKRYFNTRKTIVIIIKNDVSIKVTSVAVTVYKVKQQAQLSVIVVPVAFSLVAVVTIVFGVAYYLQNRSRFIVEVADFDFGQQYADMEYKTFKDRLKDSIINAFTRDPMPSGSDAPLWPPGHKYGSMT